MTPSAPRRPAFEAIAAGRYRLEDKLGEGGVGAVYRVFDRRTRSARALKCLSLEAARNPVTVELFEREYYVLKSLVHPNIVTAFDYGVHGPAGTPFYTMELLTGQSSHQLAPMPWRDVCRLMRDVASALTLIHSRRLVHRDVTSRNIYCSEDGTIKLIDFGGLCQLGVIARECIGTPPFMAPETVHQLPLDQRTDFYALGATAYQLLTGRHAFPAHRISELQDHWGTRPTEPSALVPEIPTELDELILALLDPNPNARPGHATLLIEKLSALASLPPLRSDAVAQAFLITPRLIGREREVALFQRGLAEARNGHAHHVWLEAAPSMGRSRLLDAFALQAQVAGALVVRLDERDGASGQALLNALSARLHDAANDNALSSEAEPSERSPEQHERVLAQLHELTPKRSVVLLVDDVHRYGAEAIALLARIARDPQVRGLWVFSQALPHPVSSVLQQLRRGAQQLELDALTQTQTHELLSSCFDHTAHLQATSTWCHAVSAGRPGVSVALAQHLVDEGIAVFRAGTWVLPETLARLALPASAEQLVQERLKRLDPDQLLCGQLLALIPSSVAVSGSEIALLLQSELSPERAHAALERLSAAQLIVSEAASTRVRNGNVRGAFGATLTPERMRELHRALALRLEPRTDQTSLCACAYHWQQAGDDERAVRATIRFAAELLLDMTEEQMSQITIPFGQWGDTFERALDWAERASWPKRELYSVYLAILTTAALSEPRWLPRGEPLFEHLKQDTGYVYFSAPELDAVERGEKLPRWMLPARLARAAVHHQLTPKRSRGLSPIKALRLLGFYATTALGVANVTQTFHTAGPPLTRALAPFRALSPAIDAVHQMIAGAIDAGRGLAAGWEALEGVIDRLQRGVKGMPTGSRTTALCILRYLHAVEVLAPNGDARALEVADWLERNGSYDTHAWQLRMIYQLYIGDAVAADRSREQIELMAADNPRENLSVIAGSKDVAQVHALCADAARLRAALESIESTAKRFPHWRGQLLVYRGEYARLVGDFARARDALAQALAFAPAGANYTWAKAVPPYIHVLVRLGQLDEAVRFGEEARTEARRVRIAPIYMRQIETALALAWASSGRHVEAAAQLDLLLRAAEAKNVRGVTKASLHEARAQVALLAGDTKALEHARASMAPVFDTDAHPALLARYRAVVAQLDQKNRAQSLEPLRQQRLEELARLPTRLEQTAPADRCTRLLEVVLSQCEADEGHLYLVSGSTANRLASVAAEPEQSPELHGLLRALYARCAREDDDEVVTATHILDDEKTHKLERWTSRAGLKFDPVPLHRFELDDGPAMLVALLHPKDRALPTPRPELLQALGTLLRAMPELLPRPA